MIKKILEYLFNKFLGKLYNYLSFIFLIANSFFENFPKGIRAVEKVILKQVFFTGIEATRVALQIGFFMGIVVITQITSFIKGLGGINLVVKIIIIAIVREIFPLLMAIIMIARSGTAITSELALMKMNNEIKTLRILNIDPLYYLIFSRIVGFIISITITTITGTTIAILSGSLTIYLIQKVSFSDFFDHFFLNLTLFDLTLFLLKCIFFGICISTICSFYGLSVGKSSTEIPQVSTRAVMSSFFYVFLINVILDFLVLIWK